MRTILAFLAGAILGIVAGAGGMLIAFPFLFPPPVLSEAMPAAAVATGTFEFDQNAPGRDRVHWANGSGQVLKAGAETVIRLEDNFEAGPGPNFWIYLNTAPVGEEADFKADAGRVKIAALKSFKGAQNYTLPAGLDISKFKTLTIWCESFGVYIGSAALPKS